jgi:hypothetical protein
MREAAGKLIGNLLRAWTKVNGLSGQKAVPQVRFDLKFK